MLDAIQALIKICNNADVIDERFGYIDVKGNFYEDFFIDYDRMKKSLSSNGFNHVLSLHINGTETDEFDFETYRADSHLTNEWTFHLNKEPLSGGRLEGRTNFSFFISQKNCLSWIKHLEPLKPECPVNTSRLLTVFVHELAEPIYGSLISFIPLKPAIENKTVTPCYVLPNWEKLKENVHFIANDNIKLNCQAWEIQSNKLTEIETAFISKAYVALSVCVASEYYQSGDKIVLDGIRKIYATIGEANSKVELSDYRVLLETISWMYEDRIQVRKKLFNERLSLDLDENDSLQTTLKKYISSAFIQAKDRYNFVIIDRKDAYLKELKELLKDIRTQSDLYAVKIRNLLSNFLRDLLAAVLLIGFTIFTKFTENALLMNNNLLVIVFNALAVYYLLSVTMQTIVDVADIYVSKKEILYWKNASKELLPENEFKRHIKLSLKERRISLRVLYPIVIICYLCVAYICHIYPDIFMEILKTHAK